MADVDHAFLRRFFQAVNDRPLEAGDDRYQPLYTDEGSLREDPVELLASAIRYSPGQSVQLLSGFQGTGKSTELKRLESTLVSQGYKVVFVDMDEYMNMHSAVNISDFLMVLAGAFGDALEAPEHLGRDPAREGYWARVVSFLKNTKVALPEISAAGFKLSLRDDASFRNSIQRHMEGHVGALAAHVWKFFEECVLALKKRHGDETEVVFIVDSMEHLRGSYTNAREVQDSIEALFSRHAERLKLPYLHVVYTVPPYLKVRSMNLGMFYGIGAVQVFPSIKVRDAEGVVHMTGVDSLKALVAKRGDWTRLLGSEAALEKLVLLSGGNIRDLLRMISEIIRRAKTLPVGLRVVDNAIDQLRNEFLPIAESDALWLADIALTHDASLRDLESLPQLTRFFDSHAVLCYRNGPEWFDVHPIIRDHVLRQAERIRAREQPGEPE